MKGERVVCDTDKLFNADVVHVNPSTPRERVARSVLTLRKASLGEMCRATGLPEEGILEEMKELRKEFGVRGNKRYGYKISNDPEQNLSMSVLIEEAGESRTVRK